MDAIINPSHALAAASLVVAVTYLYSKLYYKRFQQNSHIPQHPNSLLWGHLRLFDEFSKRGPEDRHPDLMLADMHQALGRPALMLADFWPINPPMIVVSSYEIAEQLTKPSNAFQYSSPKAPTAQRLSHLVGKHSILAKQNEEWKEIRRRFSPGFAHSHLVTLYPCILEKTKPMLDVLDSFARTGEVFRLNQVFTNMTIDVIGKVIMDEDLNTQHRDEAQQGELIRELKKLIRTYADDKLHLPWYMVPISNLKRRRIGRHVHEMLRDLVQRRYAELQTSKKRSRTILELSLQEVDVLTDEIIDETCDQLKTFLFAGHDTTSTLLEWTFYELSRTPRALQAIRDELDEIFGPNVARDPALVRERLLRQEGDELARKMTYTSAVFKETLRLYPPAGSIRQADPGAGLMVTTPDGEYNVEGSYVYINHTIIHRDPAVYGENANEFVPERWLDTKDGETAKFPAGSWRGFERGPRNCIGQELANIEARVIVAMVAHRYDFSKSGIGELDLDGMGHPVLNDKDQYNVKSEMYNTIQVSAKPVDGMKMTVKFAGL